MLRLENIRCKVGNRVQLQIDQFEITKGQLCGAIGPNGAGKTSLFKVISGEWHYRGNITFHGTPLASWAALQRARHLAVLPQNSQLTFPFTAKEVVALGLTPLSIAKREANLQIQHYMRITDCLTLAKQAYPSLSGGERQRVQLARVLLQLSQAEHPPLLLLDEPISAQDLGHQHQILALAKEFCQQREYGILIILHDLNQVIRYCDACIQLHQGHLVNKGAPLNVINEDSIERYWQYRPVRIQPQEHHSVFI